MLEIPNGVVTVFEVTELAPAVFQTPTQCVTVDISVRIVDLYFVIGVQQFQQLVVFVKVGAVPCSHRLVSGPHHRDCTGHVSPYFNNHCVNVGPVSFAVIRYLCP